MLMDTWTREEIVGRWKRTQAMMAGAGLDGLMVTEESNFRYMTGQTTPQFLHRMRPQVFLLPQRGEPALFVYGNEVNRLKGTTYVNAFKTYVDVPPYPVADLAQLIGELGWAKGAIGVELGLNQRLGLPLLDYFELQKLLPEARWCDASAPLIEVQTAKSHDEIEALRHACEISQKSWELLLSRIHPGVIVDEVDRQLALANIELGADTRGGIPAHITQLSAGTRDGVLRPGDLFKCDFHSCYKGQWSDITRIASVGEPTARHRELHAQVHTMMTECIAQLRPGRRAREIAEFNNSQRTAMGLPLLVGNKRMGHGVGLEATTPPSLNLVDETTLVPGTALAVEPSFQSEFGSIQLEECVVITKTGHETLSSGAERLGTIR